MIHSSVEPGKASLSICLGTALVAGGGLLLEVALTRVFAVMLWYHFAYMVVSLALLGFGAAGSLLTLARVGERREAVAERLALLASGGGALTLISLVVGTRIRVDSLELWKQPKNLWALLACDLVWALPFLFAGAAIGAALSWHPRELGKLYGADLLGSAAGAWAAPWLLGRLSASAVVVAAALALLSAGAAFAARTAPRRRLLHGAGALAALLLLVASAGGGWGIPALEWRVPFAPKKLFVQLFFPDGKSERTLPSATAQVDVAAPRSMPPVMAGDFGRLGLAPVTLRGVTQDGSAPTVLFEAGGDIARFGMLEDVQACSSFRALRAAGKSSPEVLVIGVGGGADVMMALRFGARHVDAVEVNRAMIRMVTRDYRDFLGRLFDDPRISLIHEEGRSFLKRGGPAYDLIQLSGVDTYTALSTGAYTLTESYLYTVEAIEDMYSRLQDGGFINISRLILTTPARRPRETLRLANIARSALERQGVREPWRQIAVFQGRSWASTMIRKGPFLEGEVEELRDFARREGFFGLVFDPFRPPGGQEDNGEQVLLAGLPPPADAGYGVAHSEAQGLIEFRRQVRGYYETVLRGSEEERRRFVHDYFFDLRPARDDRPFFFDYYRLSRLAEARRDGRWHEALPEFPVGHMVLATSLVQILLLSAVLILLPVASLARKGRRFSGKSGYLLYFGALGCGYLFVEVSLMQKLTLFLGHPTYSLSAVLATLLAFSGLGALASQRLPGPSRRSLLVLAAVVAIAICVSGWAIDGLARTAIGLERPWRVALAVFALAPVAFVLGLPFPLGLRALERQAPSLLPWGWSINGFFSVAGALLAIVIAMATGFSAVLWLAAGIYAGGLLCLPVARGPGAALS